MLVPVDKLLPCRAELLRRIENLRAQYEIADDDVGEALARALLFEHWPELVEDVTVDPASALYNRYFWYSRYVTLRQQQERRVPALRQGNDELMATHDVPGEVRTETFVGANEDEQSEEP